MGEKKSEDAPELAAILPLINEVDLELQNGVGYRPFDLPFGYWAGLQGLWQGRNTDKVQNKLRRDAELAAKGNK